MTKIKKKTGILEDFDAKKVEKSVKKAYVDAGKSVADGRDNIAKITEDVANQAKEKGEQTSEDIRNRIVDALDASEKRAAEAWRGFEKKYKKRVNR
ncbi:MAG: hypothetical protein GF334_13905 [Candidatus Altiarchaeales archaeon]|nr:hypothetical protein [Candidatus Altiarchaeales archaeon]